jgi:hypothetical protein
MSGGLSINGDSVVSNNLSFYADGGLEGNGDSNIGISIKGVGGIVSGGNHLNQIDFNAYGDSGILVNGQSLNSVVFNLFMSDGSFLGGTSDVSLTISIQGNGTINCDGIAVEDSSYYTIMNGGILSDGNSVDNVFYNSSGNDGAIVDGELVATSNFNVVSDGGSLISGDSFLSLNNNLETSGGLSASGLEYNVQTMSIDQEINFSINKKFNYDIEFQWEIGQQPLYWYRVQGSCNWPTSQGSGLDYPPFLPGGCDVMGIQTTDMKCVGAIGRQSFVQNILARNTKDLCNQITRSRLRWNVTSVKKWSRPADPTLVQQDDICNTLEEIPFEDIPECIEFIVASNPIVKITVTVILTETIKNYNGSGVVEINGNCTASIISGGVTPTTSNFAYTVTADVISTGGSASAVSSWQNEFTTNIYISTHIDQTIDFGSAQDTPAISIVNNPVATSCGSCLAMPNEIYVQNNISNPGVFYNFLGRNGLTFSSVITTSYSNKLEGWVGHQHFLGLSDDNSNQERWRFTFEFGCISEYGGDIIGSPVVKFSMIAVRKNLFTGNDYDTRLVVIFNSIDFCESIRNFTNDFLFNYNVKTNYIYNAQGIVPISTLLYDQIGIFKSDYWLANPNLTFRLSAISSNVTAEVKDISNILPRAETVEQTGSTFESVTIIV